MTGVADEGTIVPQTRGGYFPGEGWASHIYKSNSNAETQRSAEIAENSTSDHDCVGEVHWNVSAFSLAFLCV